MSDAEPGDGGAGSETRGGHATETGPETVSLEVPVSDVHQELLAGLEEQGVPVAAQLEQQLQPAVENAIHEAHQRQVYGQQ